MPSVRLELTVKAWDELVRVASARHRIPKQQAEHVLERWVARQRRRREAEAWAAAVVKEGK